MKQILTAFFVILLALNAALAGEVRTITVSNAVELALMNNLQLKQSGDDVAIAKAQLGQSFADYAVPKISANGSLTFLDPQTVNNGILDSFTAGPPAGGFPFTLIPVQYTNVFADNYSAGISVNKTLFTGFRLWNSMRVKQISLDLANRKYEDKKKEITYNTLYSFYNLFLLRENIKLSEGQDASLSNQVRNIGLNYVNGSASEYDKIRVNVLYKYNQPRLLTARNAYQTARISLCDSIGIKDYDDVEFIGNLMDYTNLILTDLTESNVLEKAFSNDIGLKTMDYSIEILKVTKDINDGAKYPTLSAFFNYKTDYEKYNMTNAGRDWVTGWNTGLQLSIPIDDWLPVSRTANSVEEVNANIRKSLNAREQMAENLSLQVKSLLMQLEVAKINVGSQLEGLNQAQLGLDVANKRYGAGAALASEIIDSEFSFTQAQMGYLQAVFDYYTSILKLKRLTGE